jgi:hypothetical protein
LDEMVERATVSVPTLEIPPPEPSEKFLVTALPASVRVPWLEMPPLPPPVMVRPLIRARAPEATLKTRSSPLPLTESALAPGPRMARAPVMLNGLPVRLMVPLTLRAKVMVSAPPLAFAVWMASRKEPGPELLVLVTIRVAAVDGLAEAIVNPGRATSKSKRIMVLQGPPASTSAVFVCPDSDTHIG